MKLRQWRSVLVVCGSISFSILVGTGSALAQDAQNPSSACPFSWERDLKVGSTGNDVHVLQQFLNAETDTQIAASGPGSAGNETDRYGTLTAKAVSRFQEKYHAEILDSQHMASGNGRVGAATRKQLNTLCVRPLAFAQPAAAYAALNTTPTSTPLLIVAPGVPISPILALSNALRVPFTSFTATAQNGDVTIKSITIAIVGAGDRRALAGVSVLDESGYVLSYAYVDSNNRATFLDPIDVADGTTVRLVISADSAADMSPYDGQVIGLNIVGIDATTPLQASFPITGAHNTVNSTLTIGKLTTTLSPEDPNSERTFHINDSRITFGGIRFTAGSAESVAINSITWEQAGTVSPGDISNVATVVGGQSYPTDVDGHSYTSTFSEPLVITKGQSVDIRIVGDLAVSGSNRTVQFNIRYPDDIFVYGKEFHYGLYPYATDNTATSGNSVFLTVDGTPDTANINPFFSGSIVDISAGSAVFIGR